MTIPLGGNVASVLGGGTQFGQSRYGTVEAHAEAMTQRPRVRSPHEWVGVDPTCQPPAELKRGGVTSSRETAIARPAATSAITAPAIIKIGRQRRRRTSRGRRGAGRGRSLAACITAARARSVAADEGRGYCSRNSCSIFSVSGMFRLRHLSNSGDAAPEARG